MATEPDWLAWRLVADSKDVRELPEREIARIAPQLQDAIAYLQQALEKMKRAA